MVDRTGARRLRLRGSAEALARALDVLHVRADVRGVLEGAAELEVRLAEPLAAWPDALDGLLVEVLPDDAAVPTGLENDCAVVVGSRIVVRPPWVPSPAGLAPDVVELVVPRGMAFGSGEHASTQAALLTLDALWPARMPGSCLDVGTGSGILARYCQLRGVGAVFACDVDGAAVAAATALVPGADVRLGGPELFGRDAADLVVANLDGTELRAALAAVLAAWRGTTFLCLAGMRSSRDEDREIAGRIERRPVHREQVGDFVALGYAGV